MDMKVRLSTLWIVVMFNIVFADILSFISPGFAWTNAVFLTLVVRILFGRQPDGAVTGSLPEEWASNQPHPAPPPLPLVNRRATSRSPLAWRARGQRAQAVQIT